MAIGFDDVVDLGDRTVADCLLLFFISAERGSEKPAWYYGVFF